MASLPMNKTNEAIMDAVVNMTNTSDLENFAGIGLLPILTILCYFILIVVTIAGNCLVIAAFQREPSLQHITNYWIISLSFTDIILASTVMPLQVAREIKRGKWYFGDFWCDVFIMLDVLCCSCSIYHLALISLDRFFCVRFPIAYPSFRTSRKTLFAIFLTWLWCTLISIPRMVVSGLKNPAPEQDWCGMTNKMYMITSSLMSFYIPLFLILVMYFLIYKATQARSQKFRRELAASIRVRDYLSKATSVGTGGGPSSSDADTTTKLNPDLNTIHEHKSTSNEMKTSDGDESSIATCNHGNDVRQQLQQLEPESPSVVNIHRPRTSLMRRIGNTLSASLTRSQTTDCIVPPTDSPCESLKKAPLGVSRYRKCEFKIAKSNPNLTIETEFGSDGDSEVVSASTAATLTSLANHRRAGRLARTSSDQERRQKKITKAKLNRKRQKQENRTARVVVIVLGAFIFLWTPFFVTNIIDPLCGLCVDEKIWKGVTLWGYVNSAVNPFIYTFFNRTFRRAITAVLKCQSKRRHF